MYVIERRLIAASHALLAFFKHLFKLIENEMFQFNNEGSQRWCVSISCFSISITRYTSSSLDFKRNSMLFNSLVFILSSDKYK